MTNSAESKSGRVLLWRSSALGLTLFFLSIALYWRVQYFEFVGLDDHVYVWNNPTVLEGMTCDGVKDVFSRPIYSTYHPLTWVSLMADTSLFGPDPLSYHRTSVLIHAANALLLYLFLMRATGSMLAAAFVASLFAVHPLNVEPVAWVSSRKDVLSGFFWLLGCWAYCALPASRTIWRIGSVTVCYVLALLAKPSMIAFPFALLLLDYWPLGRFGSPPQMHWRNLGRLVVEKATLFAVLCVSIGVTFVAAGDSLGVNRQIPIVNRLGDVAVNYTLYVGKFFVPIGLSAQYPYRIDGWPALAIAGSIAASVAITAFAWFTRKRLPFVAVGWLWFLGVMAPLCGILLVGSHSRADRYMYIPMIGLAVVIAWGGIAAARQWKIPRGVRVTAGVIVLLGYALASHRETSHWANEKALAAHMLDAHDWNPMGHYLMGKALEGDGDILGALKHFQIHLRLAPNDEVAYLAIANAQRVLGYPDQAAFWYGQALERFPGLAEAYFGLSLIAIERTNYAEARNLLERCLQLDPHHVGARQAIGALPAHSANVQTP